MHFENNKTKIDFLALAVRVEKIPKWEVHGNLNFSKVTKNVKCQNFRFVINILKVAHRH